MLSSQLPMRIRNEKSAKASQRDDDGQIVNETHPNQHQMVTTNRVGSQIT